jgi:cardiolipin synthase
MYAMPLLLIAQGGSDFATIARPFAYAFVVWGSALFVWSGLLYVIQTRAALRGPDSPRLSFGQTQSAEEVQ